MTETGQLDRKLTGCPKGLGHASTLGVTDIDGNKGHCRCAYFRSYYSNGQFVEASELAFFGGLFLGIFSANRGAVEAKS
jgi:hypothetical protein